MNISITEAKSFNEHARELYAATYLTTTPVNTENTNLRCQKFAREAELLVLGERV